MKSRPFLRAFGVLLAAVWVTSHAGCERTRNDSTPEAEMDSPGDTTGAQTPAIEAGPGQRLVVLRIEKMSCQHCVKAITQKTQAMEGVKRVEVVLDDKRGRFVVSDERPGASDLIAAINSLGYEASVADEVSVPATTSAGGQPTVR